VLSRLKKVIRTLKLREQGFEDPCSFFEAIRFPRAKILGSTFRETMEIETGILFIASRLLRNRTYDKRLENFYNITKQEIIIL
jgi:hypothetical protein